MKPLIILTLFFSLVTNAQKQEKILFVGNSFTFYWNLPVQLEKMALEQELYWDVNQSTAGGATLRDHWQGNKELKTKEILSEITFDRVIFQDQSTYPIKHLDTTKYYFSKLRSLLPQDTKIYFYATWNYPDFPVEKIVMDDSEKIQSNLKEISKEFSNIEIIPVGRAFDLFSSKYPEINLLTDDAKHPSYNGTYLAACVFFASLSGRSSKGLDRRYEGKDSNGKKIYYNIVEESVVSKCQAIADKIVFKK
jgi:hypothetical protein